MHALSITLFSLFAVSHVLGDINPASILATLLKNVTETGTLASATATETRTATEAAPDMTFHVGSPCFTPLAYFCDATGTQLIQCVEGVLVPVGSQCNCSYVFGFPYCWNW
ncbi:hypothetical protein BC830DRAFT_709226 [Chytriomyces sp. MP71]|nr:hypothetical protein BC830DRAFT_709226 [Chytriomyces sp. MP71]